jgi:beta-galactosidase
MVQIENEYGSYGNTGGNPQDLAYMEHLRDFAYANLGGPNAFQMYTTDGGDVGYMSHGAVPGVFATGDGGCGDTCDDFFAAEDQFNPPGTQAHTDSEYYTGWLTHWGASSL